MSKQQQQQATPKNHHIQIAENQKILKKYKNKNTYLERNTGGLREVLLYMPIWVLWKAWRMARPLATFTVQWRYSKPSCWSDPDRHPPAWGSAHCNEHPSPHSVRGRAVSDSISAVPHSCLFVVDREEPSGVLIRPIYGQGRRVPTPGSNAPDDLSGADVMIIKTKCSKCNMLESSRNHHWPPPRPWKNCLPRETGSWC